MKDPTRALLEAYKQKRSQLADPAREIDPLRRAYRQAAAVLHRFDPDELEPHGAELRTDDPRLLLFADIERVTGEWSDSLFTLKAEVRRTVLRELGTRTAMLAALEANPDRIRTDFQVMWEGYLRTGELPRADTLGYRDLTHLSQILDWVGELGEGLPRQADVLDLARRKSMLATFEHLVDRQFTGRNEELQMLRDYVRSTKSGRKPILAIHGPGGIGKTALLGKLLIENALLDDEERMPFAYLPFDQPSLRIEDPFTLLLEAASQFELQFPEQRPAIDRFRDETQESRDRRAALGSRKRASPTRGARLNEVIGEDRRIHLAFADLLELLGARKRSGRTVRIPVPIVFDTFEEVQYRDRERLVGFWRMLEDIQERYEPFRALISGRGPISEMGPQAPRIQQLSLEELAFEDRVTLLRHLGVASRDVAEAVAKQVGGNPLSLRLAAGVVTTDPAVASAGGIAGLTVRVDQEIIQGQLYRRILDHIHDEQVRKLAHPGMVLRRVTPDVILHVLAPLLLPSVTQMAQAEQLFEALRREHALVKVEEGALVYRPEIRRSMVRLLEQDRFGSVRGLHRAAIEYYARQGPAQRAEELYHRLALGEDERYVLDARWQPGIEQSLASSLDEYPARMKAWLASHASLEVPRSVFDTADAAEWERNITRKVQRALSELQLDWALQLLRERAERTEASPLFALEAKTHMLRSDLPEAARCLDAGVARVSTSTNRGRLAELFWLRSQVDLLGQQPVVADDSLARAEQAIEVAHNPVPLTHVLCHRLLLRRHHAGRYRERTPELRLRLDGACQRIEESTAYAFEFVVRLALDVLESEYPRTRERLGRFVDADSPAFSGDPLTSENLQGLDEYRETWELDSDPAPEALA